MRRWATFLIFAFIAAVLLALTGCGRSESRAGNGGARTPYVWSDPATGCEYLAQMDGKALTPRMDRNGKQVCR